MRFLLLIALLTARLATGLNELARSTALRDGLRAGGVRDAPALQMEGNELTFAALGDWGGRPGAPFATPPQLDVAHGLSKVVRRAGARFVIGLGDNFYDFGVESVDDDRFRATFEAVYTTPYPALRVPWLMVAGNHDHAGSVAAQLEYASLPGTHWVWPRLFYSRSFVMGGPGQSSGVSVDLLVLDGTLYNAQYLKRPYEQVRPTDEHTRLLQDPYEQRAWAVRRINESRADVLVVVCHQPLMSVAEYGGYRSLIVDLQANLERARPVVLVLSGHSHTLQLLRHNRVHYVVSGSGSRANAYRYNWFNVPPASLQFYASTPGFALLTVRQRFSPETTGNRSVTVALQFFDARARPLFHRQVP